MPLDNVKKIVLVLSGKGGVGKSSITTQLALTLSSQGHSVGVLDLDLTGPSIPRFFGIEESKVRQAEGGRLLPVPVQDASMESKRGQLSCMSLGFILPSRSSAVIWRGPKKSTMVKQLMEDTKWPDGLDYLLIDTPPGTSDEHISCVENLLKLATPEQMSGAVVVTTPQAISISDVKKELNFCRKVNVNVLGVVENMAGFVCPNCMECTHIFSKGGGQVMADEFDVPFLGSLPVDPAFVMLIEDGTTPKYPEGTTIEGRDVSNNANKDLDEPNLLVEKYQRCSLYTILDKMVTRLHSDIQNRV